MTAQAGRPSGEGRLVVGLVRGVHGLRGAVRVEVLTDDAGRFALGSVVRPEGSERVLTVADSRPDGPGMLLRFEEVPDRNAAEALREVYLEADAPAEALGADSYYWHEVIGSAVVTRDGRELGRVEDVFRAGEAEVYVVRAGPTEILVPAVSTIVAEFAPREGRIVVDEDALGLSGELEDEPRAGANADADANAEATDS